MNHEKEPIYYHSLLDRNFKSICTSKNTSVEYPDSVFNGKIDIVYVFEVNDDIFNYGAFIRREKVVSVSPLYIEVKNK